MERRPFLKNISIGALGASVIPAEAFSMHDGPLSQNAFKLAFAPHFGMFDTLAGPDLLDQLRFMKEAGFQAVEDNEMAKRPVEMQEEIGETMRELGLSMGVFVGHSISWNEPDLASGDDENLERFLEEIKSSIAVADRVDAKWITVVPGAKDPSLDMGYQTANVIYALKRAVQILDPYKITMVIEPLNFYDHPGMFLTGSAQAYEVCKAVGSPYCKILYDIYHQQIQEGNLISNITRCWDEIAYFQMADNPGRKEPGTGEINYANVLKFIAGKGYTGLVGMEHGVKTEGKDGELRVIEAYREIDRTL
ncbi:hydroxypyruvate isomerase family protein [Robertkochia aurantiaca]|uniref:hydroxypyruvate isomerase family protein n=1 Tax=Robertkochia aurantiaca TaxID=2873700 RepID=UPI001CCE67D3|nr:TIM barrel protein [Robertkochia sp. 3YJGBD-33]